MSSCFWLTHEAGELKCGGLDGEDGNALMHPDTIGRSIFHMHPVSRVCCMFFSAFDGAFLPHGLMDFFTSHNKRRIDLFNSTSGQLWPILC